MTEIMCEVCHVVLEAEYRTTADIFMFIHTAAAHPDFFSQTVTDVGPELAIACAMSDLTLNRCPSSLAHMS